MQESKRANRANVKNDEAELCRRAAMRTAMRSGCSAAVIAGLTDPDKIEDFIVGALQLESRALSGDTALDVAWRFTPN